MDGGVGELVLITIITMPSTSLPTSTHLLHLPALPINTTGDTFYVAYSDVVKNL